MSYCTDKISDSGLYSLSLQQSVTTSFIVLSFWSGNVLHRVCLGSSPRGMLLPRKILALLASFMSLFDTAPSCVSLIGFDEKLADCLRTKYLEQKGHSLPVHMNRPILNPVLPYLALKSLSDMIFVRF